MKKLIKYIVSKTAKPALSKYLSKERTYTYNNIKLKIPPQVFHPAFFFSTKMLLKHILQQDLANKKFLELGAGSGLIAFSAAKNHAFVTATDINKTAIEYLQINSVANNLPIEIIASDLFTNIPAQTFDIIAINPPYYKKQPTTDAEYAWYCGENGEYFMQLFSQLKYYMHPETLVFIILSEDCDIDLIKSIAQKAGMYVSFVTKQRILWEDNFIYCVFPK